MALAAQILHCLCIPTDTPSPHHQHQIHLLITSKPPLQSPPHKSLPPTAKQLQTPTANLIAILLRAEKPGPSLTHSLNNTVTATGWSEWLAEHILKALEETLKGGRETWGQVLSEAYDAAIGAAGGTLSELVGYVREHPGEVAAAVLVTVLAVGVLVAVMPWVLELLGFAVEGPVEGEFFCVGWLRCHG